MMSVEYSTVLSQIMHLSLAAANVVFRDLNWRYLLAHLLTRKSTI